jgi:hypothetical protein
MFVGMRRSSARLIILIASFYSMIGFSKLAL